MPASLAPSPVSFIKGPSTVAGPERPKLSRGADAPPRPQEHQSNAKTSIVRRTLKDEITTSPPSFLKGPPPTTPISPPGLSQRHSHATKTLVDTVPGGEDAIDMLDLSKYSWTDGKTKRDALTAEWELLMADAEEVWKYYHAVAGIAGITSTTSFPFDPEADIGKHYGALGHMDCNGDLDSIYTISFLLTHFAPIEGWLEYLRKRHQRLFDPHHPDNNLWLRQTLDALTQSLSLTEPSDRKQQKRLKRQPPMPTQDVEEDETSCSTIFSPETCQDYFFMPHEPASLPHLSEDKLVSIADECHRRVEAIDDAVAKAEELLHSIFGDKHVPSPPRTNKGLVLSHEVTLESISREELMLAQAGGYHALVGKSLNSSPLEAKQVSGPCDLASHMRQLDLLLETPEVPFDSLGTAHARCSLPQNVAPPISTFGSKEQFIDEFVEVKGSKQRDRGQAEGLDTSHADMDTSNAFTFKNLQFEDMDKNMDGVIDRAEFAAAQRAAPSQTATPEDQVLREYLRMTADGHR